MKVTVYGNFRSKISLKRMFFSYCLQALLVDGRQKDDFYPPQRLAKFYMAIMSPQSTTSLEYHFLSIPSY